MGAGTITITLSDEDVVQLQLEGDLNYGEALQMLELSYGQVREAAQELLDTADEAE